MKLGSEIGIHIFSKSELENWDRDLGVESGLCPDNASSKLKFSTPVLGSLIGFCDQNSEQKPDLKLGPGQTFNLRSNDSYSMLMCRLLADVNIRPKETAMTNHIFFLL